MRVQSVKNTVTQWDDTITLDSHQRHRRRIRMTSDSGFGFLLDLQKTTFLNHGDGLVLDDGRIVKVIAASEPLFKVTGQSHYHLLRLAGQLGNRHIPAQINDDHILIRQDIVIAAMVQGMRGHVEMIKAPFTPEGGAYDHHHDTNHAS